MTSLSTTLDVETLDCARCIFDFHQLRHVPIHSDVMLVLGTNDTRVAEHAAILYRQGYAPRIVVTGGIAHQGDLLSTHWQRSEAEVFTEVMLAHGVPQSAILQETRATNTAENFAFARQLLNEKGMSVQRLLVVTKPFMQRRSLATYAVEWPEVPASFVTWRSTFDEYCRLPDLPQEKIINIMLGDLQRIWIYAQRGYAAPQRIPPQVMAAYQRLVSLGYTRHLLPERV